MRGRTTAGGAALAALVLLAAFPDPAAAFPTTGVQKLLVVPVEYAHSGCPPDIDAKPTCPRNTAAQLQTILQNGLTAYYGNPATGSKTTWQVKVLINPDTSNGWWPAPSTVEQLEARAKADKNWNAYNPQGSPMRDAAEVVVSRALQRGVISTLELGQYPRFIALHNWHVFGGQSSGSNPLNYTAVLTQGNNTIFKSLSITTAFVNEGSNDGWMVRVAEHELGHQLGPLDLYAQPCPLWPPGEPAPLSYSNATEKELRTECMDVWDVMGLTGTRNPAFTYYTRVLLGWAASVPPTIRYETADFSGPVELSSLEYPNGNPIALHIPDDPNRLVIARAFGNAGYFQGFTVECRRTAWNDPIAPPDQGVLITYVDSTRDPYTDRQVVVARRFDDPSARQNILFANVKPGNSFSSLGRNFNIAFDSFTANGGCKLAVNRTGFVVESTSFIPAVNPFNAMASPDLGMKTPKAINVNPGVILNGPRPPTPHPRTPAHSRAVAARALAKAIHVSAIVPHKTNKIHFVYGNAGGKAGKGTAVVRVQQPWTATARCGAPATPQGRVIKLLTLPRLRPGAAGVATVGWVPRSSAPAAITVTLNGKGRLAAQAESATTVVGFATSRTRTLRIPLTLVAGSRCTGKVPYLVSAAIVPAGWKATVSGTTKALRKRHPVHPVVTLHPPAGKRAAATDVPITVSFGASSAEPAESANLFGATIPASAVAQVTGIDLLGRFARLGARLPAFVVPVSALIRKTPPVPTPLPAPGPPYQQTVGISGCSSAAGQFVTVSGSVTPPRMGLTVHLAYTAVMGAIPAGTLIQHTATTLATGTFSDSFNRQDTAWNVVASVDADQLYSDAVSAACAIPIP